MQNTPLLPIPPTMNATTLENGSASKSLRNGIPKIDYDMREHRVGIIISWSIIFISSGISPIVLYFALRYAAHLELGTGKHLEVPIRFLLTTTSTGRGDCRLRRLLSVLAVQTHLRLDPAEIGLSTCWCDAVAGELLSVKCCLANVIRWTSSISTSSSAFSV